MVKRSKKKIQATPRIDYPGIYTNLSKHPLSLDSPLCLQGASMRTVDLRCGPDKVIKTPLFTTN